MDMTAIFALILVLAGGLVYFVVRIYVHRWRRENARLRKQIEQSLDNILPLDDAIAQDREYIPEGYLVSSGLAAAIDALREQWDTLDQRYERLLADARAIGRSRGFQALLRPYRIYQMVERARELNQATSAFIVETTARQQTIAQLREHVPIELHQRAEQVASQIDQLETALRQLEACHMTGATIAGMRSDVDHLHQQLGVLAVVRPHDLTQGDVKIGRTGLERDLAALAQLEHAAPAKLALVTQWRTIYEASDRQLQDCQSRLALADQLIAGLPQHVDAATYETERCGISGRYVEAQRRLGAIDVEQLEQLRDEISALSLALASLHQSLQQLVEDYGRLRANIRQVHEQVEQMRSTVLALEREPEYPIVWDDVPAWVNAFGDAAAKQAAYDHLRTHVQIKQRLSEQQPLLATAQALSEQLAQITRCRQELMGLLQGDELGAGFTWLDAIARADRAWRALSFAAGNWGDANVEALSDDAQALADRQRALVLDCIAEDEAARLARLYVPEYAADSYLKYEVGLYSLARQLPQDHTGHRDFLVYQQRLRENIDEARGFGDNETRRSEIARICYNLNQLSLQRLNVSFNELCTTALRRIEPGCYRLREQQLKPDLDRASALALAIQQIRGRASRVEETGRNLARENVAAIAAARYLREVGEQLRNVVAMYPISDTLRACADRAGEFVRQSEQALGWLEATHVGLLAQKAVRVHQQFKPGLAALLGETQQAINVENGRLSQRLLERANAVRSQAPGLSAPALQEAYNALANNAQRLDAPPGLDETYQAINLIQQSLQNYSRIYTADEQFVAQVERPLLETYTPLLRLRDEISDRLQRLHARLANELWPPLSYDTNGLVIAATRLNTFNSFVGANVPAVQQAMRQYCLECEDLIKVIKFADQQLDAQMNEFRILMTRLNNWEPRARAAVPSISQRPRPHAAAQLEERRTAVLNQANQLYQACQQRKLTYAQAWNSLQQIWGMAMNPILGADEFGSYAITFQPVGQDVLVYFQ